MSIKRFDLPLIINGEAIRCSDVDPGDVHVIRYESGVEVSLPRFTREHLRQMHAKAPEIDAELAAMPVRDIITFLGRVGELWDARKLAGRMLVRHYGHLVTQFSEVMLESDYSSFGHFLAQRFHLYDTIESEFGSERIFDEWIPVQMGYRRAFPRGLVLHYLVGNLPLASMYTLIRGMVSKNRTIGKLPTRDPVTPIGLAQAVIETDPGHPVSRSLSLAYWPHDDAVGDECMASVDAACVWGGEAAVKAVKGKLRANAPLAEYGPKWSASAIDLTQCDMDKAAIHVVDDSSFYDQEACFNTQRVYVKGDVGKFVGALERAFHIFTGNLPFVSQNRDIMAHRATTLREATYLGLEVRSSDDWGIVVLPPDSELRHPLGRTIYLHPVDDLAEIASYLDRNSQTLSVYPWSITEKYRDVWASAGADRMVELGWSRMPRSGFTHDGMLGLHSMVRLVSIDRPWDDAGRYYTRRPNLEDHWFVERYGNLRATLDADPPPAEPAVVPTVNR